MKEIVPVAVLLKNHITRLILFLASHGRACVFLAIGSNHVDCGAEHGLHVVVDVVVSIAVGVVVEVNLRISLREDVLVGRAP